MPKSFALPFHKALVAFGLAGCTLFAQRSNPPASAFTKSTVTFLGDGEKSKTGDLYTPSIGRPGSWPGIVLVHGSLGVTDSIRAEAESLSKHGYLVLVVDLYEGKTVSANDDRRSALTTCEGALGFLENWSSDPEDMGAVGWGDGGSLVLEMADEQPTLKAVVDFGGLPKLPANKMREIAPRALIQGQMVPDEALALKFLDAHMRPRRAGAK
jgi:carboxymethylenebutenolidase